MKDNDKGRLLGEFNDEPRETHYEVEMYLDTDDGLELFETFKSDSPPLLPDVGEYLSVEWIEDEDESEVHDPVSPSRIGTDEPYSVLTSTSLEITDISTTYAKRNLHDDLGTVTRQVTVHKTVTLEAP